MSESNETPIVNDAITSDDAGFVSDAGDQVLGDASEGSNEAAEAVETSSDENSESSEGEGVKAETTEELKEEIQEAIEDGASEQEIKDMIKEYTIKVNGKEKTVKVDLNNEKEMIRRLQLAEVSQLSMQQKSELQKNYEADLKAILENPKAALEHLGLDPLKLGEEWIRSEVEEQKKSPEIRAKEQLERQLAEAREELKAKEEEAENARMAQLEAQEAQKLEAEIDAALDSHTSLPKSQKTVARIADALLWAIENAEAIGVDPNEISVEDVIPTVEQEIREEMKTFMEQLPEEMMEEYIGQKNLERMRKKRINSMKTNNISNVKPTTESIKKPEDTKKSKKIRSKDYFRNL